jgi:hypothetical protein
MKSSDSRRRDRFLTFLITNMDFLYFQDRKNLWHSRAEVKLIIVNIYGELDRP